MAGVGEEIGKVASGFIGVLKNEPLSLALIFMNMCLLGFFYILLTAIAAQREHEIGLLYADKKEVREMLSRCIVPESDRRGELVPLPIPRPIVE